MNTSIALLRGINVGGRNIVPMKELVRLLEDFGYEYVKFYIQSGNLVLRGEQKLNDEFSAVVERNFGFEPEVIFLTKQQLIQAYGNCPYTNADGKAVHFYFCNAAPATDEDKLRRFKAQSEEYQLINHVFYLYAPDGIGRSKLVKNIESCLGVAATGRNLNTVNKLMQMTNDAC